MIRDHLILEVFSYFGVNVVGFECRDPPFDDHGDVLFMEADSRDDPESDSDLPLDGVDSLTLEDGTSIPIVDGELRTELVPGNQMIRAITHPACPALVSADISLPESIQSAPGDRPELNAFMRAVMLHCGLAARPSIDLFTNFWKHSLETPAEELIMMKVRWEEYVANITNAFTAGMTALIAGVAKDAICMRDDCLFTFLLATRYCLVNHAQVLVLSYMDVRAECASQSLSRWHLPQGYIEPFLLKLGAFAEATNLEASFQSNPAGGPDLREHIQCLYNLADEFQSLGWEHLYSDTWVLRTVVRQAHGLEPF
jgi:hypothetical protein